MQHILIWVLLLLVLIQTFNIKRDIRSYDHGILALNVYMMRVMVMEDEIVEGVQQTLYQLLFMQYLLYVL